MHCRFVIAVSNNHGFKQKSEPLMDWEFISVEKIGSHHIVSLTDEGITALRFLHEGR